MRRLRSLLSRLRRSVVRPIGRFAGELVGIVPALIAGAGVFLVVAGLFYYLQPVAAANSAPSATPTLASVAPYTLPPLASTAPSAGTSTVAAIATRVRIRGTVPPVDLPIVTSPAHEEFPLCDAAEYYTVNGRALAYPGLPQATYLYAHARDGMFGPLWNLDKAKQLPTLIGLWVEVYTADNQDHVYQITQILPGVSVSDPAWIEKPASATSDQLWLQTSEGPYETSTKLQIVAEPIGVVAASATDSHPTGKGSVCPKAPVCKLANGAGCTPP
jgi:hypothetical protein